MELQDCPDLGWSFANMVLDESFDCSLASKWQRFASCRILEFDDWTS